MADDELVNRAKEDIDFVKDLTKKPPAEANRFQQEIDAVRNSPGDPEMNADKIDDLRVEEQVTRRGTRGCSTVAAFVALGIVMAVIYAFANKDGKACASTLMAESCNNASAAATTTTAAPDAPTSSTAAPTETTAAPQATTTTGAPAPATTSAPPATVAASHPATTVAPPVTHPPTTAAAATQCELPHQITVDNANPGSTPGSGGTVTITGAPVVISTPPLIQCGGGHHYKLSYSARLTHPDGSWEQKDGSFCSPNGSFSENVTGSAPVGAVMKITMELPPNSCG